MLPSKSFKSIFLAILGTFIEYYDYALFGFFAPVFAREFFPKASFEKGLLYTYAIFIAGSCAKPFGSLFFGPLSDRLGRSVSLKISMIGIAFPTLIIGFLPGFNAWGYTAPMVLLCCKFLQGFFVAGESDTVRVYLFEIIPKKYQCFANSLSYFICLLGIYTASLITSYSLQDSLANITFFQSWRFPFILGGFLGLGLYLIRKSLCETSEFLNVKDIKKIKKHQNIFSNKKSLLITLLTTGAIGGQYHFYFVFFNQYLSNTLKIKNETSYIFSNSDLLFIFTLLLPVAGWLADKVGIKRFLSYSYLYLFIMILFNFVLFNYPVWLNYAMALTAIALGLTHSCTFVLLFNLFETDQRCTALSLGHSLGSILLSASAPFISLLCWQKTQMAIAPLYYLLMLCTLSFMAFLAIAYNKFTIETTYFVKQNP